MRDSNAPYDNVNAAINRADSSFHDYSKSRGAKTSNRADDAASNIASLQLPGLTGALSNDIAPFIDTLRIVAKLHPWCGVAVGAFTVAFDMNMKRHENDLKIRMLLLSMRNTMETFCDLKKIDPADPAYSTQASTLRTALERHVRATAGEIEAAAEACDTYSKKRLITKLLRARAWGDTFATHATRLAERRMDLLLALATHTGEATDKTHAAVTRVEEDIAKIRSTFEVLAHQAQGGPEEASLREVVERHGGVDELLADDQVLGDVLKEIADAEAVPDEEVQLPLYSAGVKKSDEELALVKQELVESTREALERNRELFTRKFKLLEERVIQGLHDVTRRESDRVIKELTAGPHEEILDNDIYRLWVDAGWRRRVDSAQFGIALYEYLEERSIAGRMGNLVRLKGLEGHLDANDQLAFGALTVPRMQRVVEAIDVDCTGFVTVALINKFTSTRPKSWSLLQWIAYWAAGWEESMADYSNRIRLLVSKMFALRPMIHTVDQELLDRCLTWTYRRCEDIVPRVFRRSHVVVNIPSSLAVLFDTHNREVEKDLRDSLNSLRYNIDTMDTLRLIIGSNKIETVLFPLMYLVVAHDFQVMRICRTKYVNPEDLLRAHYRMGFVYSTVWERYKYLNEIHNHVRNGSSAGLRLKYYACGIFDSFGESPKSWSLKALEESINLFPELEYKDEDEGPLDMEVLNYPLATDYLYEPEDPCPAYDAQAEVSPDVQDILGVWNGFFFRDPGEPCVPMYSFNFQPGETAATFVSRGRVALHLSEFIVSGHVEASSTGAPTYVLSLRFVPSYYKQYNGHLRGTLSSSKDIFTGVWGISKQDLPFTFEYRRLSPRLLALRPSLEKFRTNRPRALWDFALAVVRADVRRVAFSKSHFEERRRLRHAWVDFRSGHLDDSVQDPAGYRNAGELLRRTSYEDAFYYYTTLRSRIVTHQHDCDNCNETIKGVRAVCLECGTIDTVDLCDRAECMRATVRDRSAPDAPPHRPTHDIALLRKVVSGYHIGRTLRRSKNALVRARMVLDEVDAAAKAAAATAAPGAWAASALGLRIQRAPRHPEASMSTQPKEGGGGPTCVGCKRGVGYPCYACFECEDLIFVCGDCDGKPIVENKSHKINHGLVRCLPKMPQVDDTADVKTRIASLEMGLHTLENRFRILESKLDERMGRMETLLLHMVANNQAHHGT